MAFDWKKTVKSIAPLIGTAIGGPFGGMATAAITSVLGVDKNSSEAQIEAAVKNATPEQLVALKSADQAFKVQMRELDIAEDDLHAKDRDSARNREIALGGDWVVQTLAVVIMVGFLAMCGYLLGYGLGEGVSAGLAGTVVGYVSAKAEQVCSYYFGSSKGSKDKTTLSALK
jgi:hypothetical protein